MEPAKSASAGKLAYLRQVNGFVFLCVVVFAMASWIDLHFVWVELPIFVATLPEEWRLPSYLMVSVVIAYIGPCLYMLSTKVCTNIDPKRKETAAGIMIIGVDMFISFLLIFFWDSTAYIFGAERSVALLVLCFILSMVDCCSYLVFCPFMTRLPSQYMAAYFAGEGFGGFLGGCVGLMQGVSGDGTCVNTTESVFNETSGENITFSAIVLIPPVPRFSASIFFIILVCVLGLSMTGFLLLNFSETGKREMLPEYRQEPLEMIPKSRAAVVDQCDLVTKPSKLGISAGERAMPQNDSQEPSEEDKMISESSASVVDNTAESKRPSKLRLAFLIFFFGFPEISLYAVCDSLLPYASLPYGSMAYTLAIRLSSIVGPISALSTYIITTRSLKTLSLTTGISTVLSIYIIYLAVLSPNPPFVGKPTVGTAIVVTAYVTLNALVTYAKTSAGMMLHQEAGHSGVTLAGIISLVFFSMATIICFVLINVLNLFTQVEPCT